MCLALLMWCSPLLFGGAFGWTTVAIAALAVVTLVVVLRTRRDGPAPARRVVGVVMVAAWVWTCLQAVPVPRSIARALSLHSAEIADRLSAVFDLPVTTAISADPGATQTQILIGASVVCAFLSANILGATHARMVTAMGAISAATVGLVTLAHSLLGATAVYGVYTPRFVLPTLLSPLMNNNHLGGLLVVGAILGVGLATDGRERPRRLWWLAVVVVCAGLVPVTLSRGAIAALLFGVVCWMGVAWSKRKSDALSVSSAIAIACVFGALVFAGLGPLLRRFETTGIDKLQVALDGLSLLDGPAWIVGVGRGAFSATFAEHYGTIARVSHPENLVVQWTTEWGLPVAFALIATLSFAMFNCMRGLKSSTRVAMTIAICALVLQNMVDFSLEMPGVVVVAAALLGSVLSRPSSGAPVVLGTQRFYPAVAGVAALSLVVLAIPVARGGVQANVDTLSQLSQQGRTDAFDANFKRALRRHPSEPTLYLLAATEHVRTKSPDAPKWLTLAMQRAPGWSAPHVATARWLLQLGKRDQALVELSEAESRHAGSAQSLLCAVLGSDPAIAHVERAAPKTRASLPAYYDRVSTCPAIPRSLSSAIDARALAIDPGYANAAVRQADRMLASSDPKRALELLQPALHAHPADVRLWQRSANALLANKQPEQAMRTLQRARQHTTDSSALLETIARTYAKLGQLDKMRATLMRVRGISGGDPKKLADAYTLEGQLEAELGHIDRAINAHDAAADADPTGRGLANVAQVAEEAGRLFRAFHAHRRRCALQPNSDSCAHEQRLKERLGGRAPQTNSP